MDRRFKAKIERYLAKQVASSTAHIRSRDVDGEFDLWHVHPDFDVRANRAAPLVAAATLQLLAVAQQHFARRCSPLQIFATFCENTGDNAVYVHSCDGNAAELPFAGVVWGVELPQELRSPVFEQGYEFGRIQYATEVVHVVRARA